MLARTKASTEPTVVILGGKRQLLDVLASLLPDKITTYCEPFVCGGALLFKLQPKTAYINDINSELIGAYQTSRKTPSFSYGEVSIDCLKYIKYLVSGNNGLNSQFSTRM